MFKHVLDLGRVFLLFVIMVSVPCCGSGPRGHDANVLLIVIDTLRADHLGCYGYDRDISPNIDAFAENGVLFKNAYCQMPTTGPSHASLFTSRYPRDHGVLKNGWALPTDSPTLAEILKENEYVTSAIVSSVALSSKHGFAAGFDHYDDTFSVEGSSVKTTLNLDGRTIDLGLDQRAHVTTQKALDWLRKNGKKKFFLFVHYFDPHVPYDPPPQHVIDINYETATPLEQIVAKYDGEIWFTDRLIGPLLHYLAQEGLDRNTLMIITSDHGEGLGQHGWIDHGINLYDELVRIPLIMRFEGIIPEDKTIDITVQEIDIAPTILDLLGLDGNESFSGRSLVPLIRGKKANPDYKVFLERRHYENGMHEGVDVSGNKFGIRHKDMKYIWSPEKETEELYDLSEDPAELSNTAASQPDTALEFRNVIKSWKEEIEAKGKRAEQTIDEETQKKLKALGYLD